MPAQARSATSESLLPSVDYQSAPVCATRPEPELRLVSGAATPANGPAARPASATAPPAEPALESEAPAGNRRLAALQSLSEEEIIALFS
jgi:hypothetical protein